MKNDGANTNEILQNPKLVNKAVERALFFSGLDPAQVNKSYHMTMGHNLNKWLIVMLEHGYESAPLSDLEEETVRAVPCHKCQALDVASVCRTFDNIRVREDGGGVTEVLKLCFNCMSVTDAIERKHFWIQPFSLSTADESAIMEVVTVRKILGGQKMTIERKDVQPGETPKPVVDIMASFVQEGLLQRAEEGDDFFIESVHHIQALENMLKLVWLSPEVRQRASVIKRLSLAESVLHDLLIEFEDFGNWLKM